MNALWLRLEREAVAQDSSLPRVPLAAVVVAGRKACALISVTTMALTLIIGTNACAHSPSGPGEIPPREDLLQFLNASAAVQAIAGAADTEGLLSSGEDGMQDLEDLEAAARALGIRNIRTLSRHVDRVVENSPVLFAALNRVRQATRKGDVAHWVAVALVGLDEENPDETALRADTDWEPDYVDDVLTLREVNARGELGELALGTIKRHPIPHNLTIIPTYREGLEPQVEARRSTGFWPVFARPGVFAIAGTIALKRGDSIEWDQLRVLMRNPGTVRVNVDRGQPWARFHLEDTGELTPAGTIEIEVDQRLDLLMESSDRGSLAMLEPSVVVELPWGCCNVEEPADNDWWVRLSSDERAGAWVMASTDAFYLSFPAVMAWLRERRASEPRRPRLGDLSHVGTFDVPGARLAYWLEGSREALPLVVLHGGPGLGSTYLREPLKELLGVSRLLVFYDQRGSGYSEGADDPERLRIEQFVLDLDAIRAATGFEQIDILGHSFGGLLGMVYAFERPDRVGKLVLVDPDPARRADWEVAGARLEARTSPEDAARLAEITWHSDWGQAPELLDEWFSIRLRAYMADPADAAQIELHFDAMTLANFLTTPAVIRANLGEWDFRADLAEVRAQTLILAGDDSVFPLEAMEALNAAIPNSSLEILDGVGHFPFVEAPELFAEIVLSFLEHGTSGSPPQQ